MSNLTENRWPALGSPDLRATTEALHLWSQVVGKIRLMLTPWLNHSWHVPLYVSARGLTTSLIPHAAHPFEIEFDLLADTVILRGADGGEKRVPLKPQSVAQFYANVMQALGEMDIAVQIDPMPCELPGAMLFHNDVATREYNGDMARTYWRALLQVQCVFGLFRTRFVGKCSPVHLFWGSFDLAVTRFSGRAAPRHPGGMAHVEDAVARDAYNQEVSSAGFWPGGDGLPPSFYSYAWPAPAGFGDAPVLPAAASFNAKMGEFLLPYEAVRSSADPDDTLLKFLQSTYEAASNLAQWDRAMLERETGAYGRPPDSV
jgi:hypothetical protein